VPEKYALIARQASLWSANPSLSANKRMLAKLLAELAEILADPQYGCPAEHYAADVMYCCLCKNVFRTPSATTAQCPGPADCPHLRQIGQDSAAAPH
jgi:hypothetical protein